MAKVKITKDRCKGCYLCISYCPKALLKKDAKLNVLGIQAVVFEDRSGQCSGCGFCALICPECCVEVEKE
ncbi:MAG: 4Fe-4S binding protein [Candidatus Omnitrophota bacterium]